jgi:hypothetical protein
MPEKMPQPAEEPTPPTIEERCAKAWGGAEKIPAGYTEFSKSIEGLYDKIDELNTDGKHDDILKGISTFGKYWIGFPQKLRENEQVDKYSIRTQKFANSFIDFYDVVSVGIKDRFSEGAEESIRRSAFGKLKPEDITPEYRVMSKLWATERSMNTAMEGQGFKIIIPQSVHPDERNEFYEISNSHDDPGDLDYSQVKRVVRPIVLYKKSQDVAIKGRLELGRKRKWGE